MRTTILLCLLLSTVLSKPESYFHQQYQYKSSSSSYKNNELAHKNDDEGFYSSHGDIEGRTKPKVDSYSQHSEYINPKFRSGKLSQWVSGGHDSGLSALDFNSGASGYGQNYLHSSGTSGSGVYGSGGTSFGTTGQSGSLYPTGQLQILTQQLQDDLSRQLESAIYDQQQRHHSSSSYTYGGASGSGNYGANIQLLEQELQNNLTRQLQEALDQQYGQQSRRGTHYYSVTSGGAHSSEPNYSTVELERLRKQLEDNLVKQLQQDFNAQSIQTSKASTSLSSTNFGVDQTNGYHTKYQSPGYADSQTIHLTPGSHHSNSFSSAIHNSKPTYYSSTPYRTSLSHGSTSYGTSSSHGTYGGVERSPVVPLTDVDGQLGTNLIVQYNPSLATQKYSDSSFSSSYRNQNRETHPGYQSELQALNERPHNVTREQQHSYQYKITSGSAHSVPDHKVDASTNLRQLQIGDHQQQVKQIGGFRQQQVELIQPDGNDFGRTHISNFGHHHGQKQLSGQHNLHEQLEISSGNKGYYNRGDLGYNTIHSTHQEESKGSRYTTNYGGQGNTFGQIHYNQPQAIEDFSELTDLNLQSGKNQNTQLTESLNKHIKDQKKSGYDHHSSYSSYSSSSSHTSYETQSGLHQENNEAKPRTKFLDASWK